MNASSRLHLFEGYGVELEYMLVRRDSLDVSPIADRVLFDIAGCEASEVEVDEASWSNELILHVIELKNTHPVPSLDSLPALFQRQVQRLDQTLERFGVQLMPSAMHPWMDPARQSKLWPHECREIYEAYHRIFDCFRHGWANLQSVHLNLPFAGDDEFARLHAAVRVLLPILPALAASSPICDGRASGWLDTRMEAYRTNAACVPSMAASVIPEPIFSESEYRREIFEKIYADIAPHDAAGALQHEFLNSRGAIARFDRGAIEIRVLDVQECPLADVAICAAISHVLKELVSQSWSDARRQQSWSVQSLYDLLTKCMKDADEALITDAGYLDLFGYPGETPATAGQLWRHLIETACANDADFDRRWRQPLLMIIDHGPLARRILRSIGADASPERLAGVYRSLCDCLRSGVMFED